MSVRIGVALGGLAAPEVEPRPALGLRITDGEARPDLRAGPGDGHLQRVSLILVVEVDDDEVEAIGLGCGPVGEPGLQARHHHGDAGRASPRRVRDVPEDDEAVIRRVRGPGGGGAAEEGGEERQDAQGGAAEPRSAGHRQQCTMRSEEAKGPR